MAQPGGGSAERPGLGGAALSPAAERQGLPGPRPWESQGRTPSRVSIPAGGSRPRGSPGEDGRCGVSVRDGVNGCVCVCMDKRGSL